MERKKEKAFEFLLVRNKSPSQHKDKEKIATFQTIDIAIT